MSNEQNRDCFNNFFQTASQDERFVNIVNETIFSRRSVRRYQNQDIPDECINYLINAANWAPSACDVQGWKYIVINDKEKLDAVIAKGAASFLKNNSCSILVLYDNRTDNIEYRDHIQSASAAIQNMLLTAHSLGLGACWVCNLPSKKYMRKLFAIPKCYDPVALVAIGVPFSDRVVERKRKYTISEIVSYNKFDCSYYKSTIKEKMMLLVRRFARKIYYACSPGCLLRKYAEKYEKKFES